MPPTAASATESTVWYAARQKLPSATSCFSDDEDPRPESGRDEGGRYERRRNSAKTTAENAAAAEKAANTDGRGKRKAGAGNASAAAHQASADTETDGNGLKKSCEVSEDDAK